MVCKNLRFQAKNQIFTVGFWPNAPADPGQGTHLKYICVAPTLPPTMSRSSTVIV